MSAPFKPFLWPDRVIGKRDSRAIREAHNALYNSHAELLAALKRLRQAEDLTIEQFTEKEISELEAAMKQAGNAIAKAEGRA